MPDESEFDCSRIQQPEDLDGLSKEELVAFLRSDCEGKTDLWHLWYIDRFRKSHMQGFLHLDNIDLSDTQLQKADFLEADLRGSLFRNTQLQHSMLAGARLQGADLYRAQLQNAMLSGARLDGARLIGANLDFANLQRTDFRDVGLSSVASMHGVRLYQARFWGVLDLRFEQFLNTYGDPTIWEHVTGRFSEAKDVYKTLKGYFEDAGDYEGANWAFGLEQRHEKWMRCPTAIGRIVYRRRWRRQYNDPDNVKSFCNPNFSEWARLVLYEGLANYGLSLALPFLWLGVLILGCGFIYWLSGSVTSMPGCSYAELSAVWRSGCAPTRNLLDHLWFSLGAITTIDVGTLRAFKSHTGVLMTLETLSGIGLTGLIGFVLGNKLRFS